MSRINNAREQSIVTIKTHLGYRISVIFRVRSAKAVKITDLDLIKRLGIILAIFTTFLAIRTMVEPPHVIVARTADDLKAYICQTDWWDHVFTASKCFFTFHHFLSPIKSGRRILGKVFIRLVPISDNLPISCWLLVKCLLKSSMEPAISLIK